MGEGNKTVPTDGSVEGFVEAVEDEQQRADCRTLIELMRDVSGCEAVLWGPSIVGFDRYHYRYESGREGDSAVLSFSPRKGKLAIYVVDGFDAHADALAELGRHSTATACLYVRRLADVDLDVLRSLLSASYAATKAAHP